MWNVRFWHRADKLPELKVCYEREAEVGNANSYMTNIEEF
ncbi:hypothetical protein [Klebsiella pneumoniae IS53]|nr:hypothetical protein [Klebsiella pneumoniae IS53]